MSKRTVRFIFLTGLFLGAFSVTAAAAAPGADWGWWGTLGRWLNLLILVGLIVLLVRRPLTRYFSNRRLEIQRELHEARQGREEAESRLKEIEEKLRNLEAELSDLRARAEREAELERRRIVQDADLEIERIMGFVRREVEILTRSARAGLRSYGADLMVRMAEQQIRREMMQSDEERVIRRFFDDLDRGLRL